MNGDRVSIAPLRFIANAFRQIAIDPPRTFATNAYPNAANGALWSIPFEFWCYLGVAGLGLAGLLGAAALRHRDLPRVARRRSSSR